MIWFGGEIVEALKRKLPLIPVLIQNAAMPRADELSKDLRLLTRRNAIELSHQRWKEDVQRLLKALDRFVLPSKAESAQRRNGKTVDDGLATEVQQTAGRVLHISRCTSDTWWRSCSRRDVS